MKSRIVNELIEIERNYEVKVIYAKSNLRL